MGAYVLVADQWDQIVSAPGAPLEYKRRFRGDVVDIDDDVDAERLLRVGAVRPGGLTSEPADGGPPAGDGGDSGAGKGEGGEGEGEGGATPERPALTATKEQWVDYAVAHGMSAEEARAMVKQDLIRALG